MVKRREVVWEWVFEAIKNGHKTWLLANAEEMYQKGDKVIIVNGNPPNPTGDAVVEIEREILCVEPIRASFIFHPDGEVRSRVALSLKTPIDFAVTVSGGGGGGSDGRLAKSIPYLDTNKVKAYVKDGKIIMTGSPIDDCFPDLNKMTKDDLEKLLKPNRSKALRKKPKVKDKGC